MKTIRLSAANWAIIEEAAVAHAETFPVNTEPRAKIFRALNRVKDYKPRVHIEVHGGVADCTRVTPGVRVTIKDHDNH